jgi:hypothetical protein
MRESALFETEGDTLTLNILLANTSHYLRDVEIRAFRASIYHGLESVPRGKGFESCVTTFISSFIKLLIYFGFKGFHHAFTWLRFQLS